MRDWPGVLTRKQAIQIIDCATDKDDPYWEGLVEDFYCEKTDTMPSIFHLFAALGVTADEYKDATGAENVDWPESLRRNVYAAAPAGGLFVQKDAEGQWYLGRPKGPAVWWDKCELSDLLNLGFCGNNLERVVVNHVYRAVIAAELLEPA